jgi:energy-coupling factor transport system substrate-specific component
VFTELVAAAVSTLLGSPWGLLTLLYGLFQGLAGEFAFALTGYRSWRLPTALLGAGMAGAAATLVDLISFYPDTSAAWKWAYLALVVLSSVVIAGLGSVLLTRQLAQTGVLDRFPSGRERATV